VTYRGRYPLLRGLEMSEAYASILRISFDVTVVCWSGMPTTGPRSCCRPR
jgi:hypothetical protein